jgi:hypothetical protein
MAHAGSAGTTASLDGLPLLLWMVCKQPRVRKRAARPRRGAARLCVAAVPHGNAPSRALQRTRRLAGNAPSAGSETAQIFFPANARKSEFCGVSLDDC